MTLSDHELREIDKIVIIACGTAYHSGMIAKYAIEHWTRIPTEVELASEFRYRDPILNSRILVIAISQSGETMDTLMAMRYAREQGSKVLAICNTQGSTIPREADAALYTYAGPEIAVASTKAFLTQVVACYLVALYLAQVRGNKYGDEIATIVNELSDMPGKVDLVLDTTEGVRALAQEFADAPSVLFIGRHVGFPVALEGALKLKRTGVHARGGLRSWGVEARSDRAAGGGDTGRRRRAVTPRTWAPAREDRVQHPRSSSPWGKDHRHCRRRDELVVPYADHIIRIPACPTLMQPLVATVPLQVFACELATVKGHDVDQPRNLAKSVTVE